MSFDNNDTFNYFPDAMETYMNFDNEIVTESSNSYISDFDCDSMIESFAPDAYTDPLPEEQAPSRTVPRTVSSVRVTEMQPASVKCRGVKTRYHLKLPKRIPAPPDNFKSVEPPFLPPPIHSDFYPFDSLNDAKCFLAHNNDTPEKTWVCVPVNFINRFRNDRDNEQHLYGYLIKSDT